MNASLGGGRVLRRLRPKNPVWLDHTEQATPRDKVRAEKDKFFQERLRALGGITEILNGAEIGDKLGLELGESKSTSVRNDTGKPPLSSEGVNDALRMYRILRPNADPFYKEDARLSLASKLGTLFNDKETAISANPAISPMLEDIRYSLPVLNPRSFLIALKSVASSISEDLEDLVLLLAGNTKTILPEPTDPERFKILVDMVFGKFRLKKDPAFVDEFLLEHWDSLRTWLPEGISSLPVSEIAEWLRNHLTRVNENQRADFALNKWKYGISKSPENMKTGDEEWYAFSEDFMFDNYPISGKIKDERNLDFPLEKAGEWMNGFLRLFGGNGLEKVTHEWQQLVWDLEKIGLREWIKMDISELETKLPSHNSICQVFENSDIETAKLMLKCAARGKVNLLDFDAIDPFKLVNEFPTKSVKEELADFPENRNLSDLALDEMITRYSETVRNRSANSEPTAPSENDPSQLEQMLNSEKETILKSGAAEWSDESFADWKWKRPTNTLYDPRRGNYVRQQGGVDPNLNVSALKQHTLQTKRLNSMTANGRVFYYRSIVLVGNGKGVYGFGIGFGYKAKDSGAAAAVKALRNLKFVDLDSTKTIPFPVRGKEFSSQVDITPLRQGKGIHTGRRYLPIAHLLGLDNIRMRFKNGCWFSRFRALDRALEQIQSRRTLANSTGKRYADIIAPGDDWVHWPDRWFNKLRETYDDKERKSKALRKTLLRAGIRSSRAINPLEVKPGWHKTAWKNPLVRWSDGRRNKAPNTM